MRDPIYEPRGAAREYAGLALNIYEGCTHGCSYCYAPAVMRKSREEFAQCRYRSGLMQALERQLSRERFEGRTVHLCFSCDPYPRNVDTSPTRDVIRLLKESGCHVQILTKNPVAAELDIDLLDEGDTLGTTFTGAGAEIEPNSPCGSDRLHALERAKKTGVGTWVSCEPVIGCHEVYAAVMHAEYIDRWSFGKLNHGQSDIDWAAFGRNVELVCQHLGRDYVIKRSLRDEMGKAAS